MRFIGLDVHRDHCEVAIAEDGRVRSAGKFKTNPESVGLFAESLGPEDQVALEATFGATRIAQLIEPHVARVVVANTRLLAAVAKGRAKTDRRDAQGLARMLAAGFLEEVWPPDQKTGQLRRLVARRAALMRARNRAKNECHAALARTLAPRPPMKDAFGKSGRRWLAELELPFDERLTVDGCLRQVDFLCQEIVVLDRELARQALDSPQIRRLMTVPGVSVGTACAFMASVGDIRSLLDPTQARGVSRAGSAGPPVWIGARPSRAHLQGRCLRGTPHAWRGRLVGRKDTGTDARLLRPRRGAPRPPGRRDRHRSQAMRAVLAAADARRGLCLRPADDDAPQAQRTRTPGRRAAPTRTPARRRAAAQPDDPQGREGSVPPSRARIPALHHRLEERQPRTPGGRRRDTGARIYSAV